MMKRIFNNTILKCIIALCVAVTLIVTVTFAWFAIKQSGAIYVVTGNVNANAKMYYGNDENNDGFLDGWDLYTTRSDILANTYTELTKSPLSVSSTIFSNINFGKCIVYKVVIENPSVNDYSINASVNMSNLFNYFYLQLSDYALEQSDGDAEEFVLDMTDIQNYVARMLLCFDKISYSIYDCQEGDTDFNSKVGETVELSNSTEDYSLWKYSNCEKFVENIVVESGQLLEIDFRIKYVYDSQSMTNYLSSISDVSSVCYSTCISKLIALGYTQQQAETYARGYIQAMSAEEQACLSATSDYALIDLNLLIEYFEISLEQI